MSLDPSISEDQAAEIVYSLYRDNDAEEIGQLVKLLINKGYDGMEAREIITNGLLIQTKEKWDAGR